MDMTVDRIMRNPGGEEEEVYHLTESLYAVINDGGSLVDAESLLDRGADPCSKVSCGHTSLGRAVQLLRPAWLILRLVRSASEWKKDRMNTRDTYGRTPLHYAAESGDLPVVCMLVGAGCKLDVGDRENVTPLHLASSRAHESIVVSLLRFGAKVNLKTAACYEKVTPLHIAASRGVTRIVELLLESGAKVDCTDRKEQTPLFLAVSREHVDTSRVLLEFGANPNWKQVNDYTPLFEAVTRNNKALVDLLLSHGATTHPSHYLLHQAIGRNFVEVALSLIKVGFSIYSTDRDGWSPLHLACQRGSVRLVQELLFQGADPNSAHPSSGVTPLIATVRWLQATEIETFSSILHLLEADGAKLDKPTKSGQTPLKVALSGHKLEFFTLLVAHGADVGRQEHGFQEILGDIFVNFGAELVQFLWLAGLKFNQELFQCPEDPVQRGKFIRTVLACRNECLPLKAACRLGIRGHVAGRQPEDKPYGLFPMIESLPVPQAVKEYLKFYHM